MPLVQYDFLFLRIASCIFGTASLDCDLIIQEIYQEEEKVNKESERLNDREALQKWISFIALVSEVVVSNKTDICFANLLELRNKELEQ